MPFGIKNDTNFWLTPAAKTHYVEIMRYMRDFSSKYDINKNLINWAHLEANLKCDPHLLDFYFPHGGFKATKVDRGYWIVFKGEATCPLDGEVLWYFDSHLELASGSHDFPAERLTEAQKEEVAALRAAAALLKAESWLPRLPSIPIPFQSPRGCHLWLMPDGTIKSRVEASVTDQTVEFAEKVLGYPREPILKSSQDP